MSTRNLLKHIALSSVLGVATLSASGCRAKPSEPPRSTAGGDRFSAQLRVVEQDLAALDEGACALEPERRAMAGRRIADSREQLEDLRAQLERPARQGSSWGRLRADVRSAVERLGHKIGRLTREPG